MCSRYEKKYIKNEEDFVGRDGIDGRNGIDGRDGKQGEQAILGYAQYRDAFGNLQLVEENSYIKFPDEISNIGNFIEKTEANRFILEKGLYLINLRLYSTKSDDCKIVININNSYYDPSSIIIDHENESVDIDGNIRFNNFLIFNNENKSVFGFMVIGNSYKRIDTEFIIIKIL